MTEEIVQTQPTPEPPVAEERLAVHPMRQRFLFVDIAAQRAKQLRRGALNKIALAAAAQGVEAHLPHKAERAAMEEVKRGFIAYELPEAKPHPTPPEAKA